MHLNCLEKHFFSSCLLLWELLLILEILPKAASESPPPPPPTPNKTGSNSKGIVSLNSTFEKADSQTFACYFEKKYSNTLQNLVHRVSLFRKSLYPNLGMFLRLELIQRVFLFKISLS